MPELTWEEEHPDNYNVKKIFIKDFLAKPKQGGQLMDNIEEVKKIAEAKFHEYYFSDKSHTQV